MGALVPSGRGHHQGMLAGHVGSSRSSSWAKGALASVGVAETKDRDRRTRTRRRTQVVVDETRGRDDICGPGGGVSGGHLYTVWWHGWRVWVAGRGEGGD